MKNQPKNGLIIKRFFGDEEDRELIRLIPFFKYLAEVIVKVEKVVFNLL